MSQTYASMSALRGAIIGQQASFERRAQEWEFQRDLSGFDINIANQQIKIAYDNISIVTQEREIAQLEVDHAKNSYEYIKNKFTNTELYHWMSNVLERCYSYMLNLATSTAKTAERQLHFERQEYTSPIILNDYWQTPSAGSDVSSSKPATDRRGLTGSARLLVDITRLDQYAFDSLKRKLQMTKVISLAQNFPVEFQMFKETGVLNFELTNKLFDYDFPGHYLRLINNVKTSVIGLVPVYDNIKASLTADTISYTIIGGNTFQKIPIKRLELDSVALTSTMNATGVFEMQSAQGDLINPFEGMGIESRWEFKMPHYTNRMDFDSIVDVVFAVDYTALDSNEYRMQVLKDQGNSISFNRAFSFRNDYLDQWYELGEVMPGSPVFDVTFEIKKEHFPQGISNLRMNGDILLFFSREDDFAANGKEIKGVDIELAPAGNVVVSNKVPAGKTSSGILTTTGLMNSLNNNKPLNKFRLYFKNSPENRALFADEKIKDIIMVVKCKADLKSYPL